MSISLDIKVFCESCIVGDEFGGDSDTQMQLDENPYFNSETRNWAQDYKCPICEHRISVIIGMGE